MTQLRDPELSHYMALAHSEPVLTREEEEALTTRWYRHQDRAAAERLIRAHLRCVIACAVRHRRYQVPLNELIAEGNFGLAHALTKFQPERGCRFVTYAGYWIRAYVLNYVIHSWSMVGGGSGPLRSKLFFRLRREHARLTNLFGEVGAADDSMGRSLGIAPAKVATMMRRLEARDVSLDAPIRSDSPRPWGDLLSSDQSDQEARLAASETRDYARSAVRSALATLSTRERFVVEARLLADCGEELTLAEIGRRLGVSRERARQLESRAKNKLRTAIIRLSDNAMPSWLEGVAA